MQRHFDFLLLGGGPASVSAAETLRAEGAKGSILLVSDQVYSPYGCACWISICRLPIIRR
jgi:pyruvate/2-oxoglutarate dehydrogenase complex dihydrolipoamide dehydrogenase (E3) component